MSMGRKETVADIVAEMRQLSPEKFLVTPWFCEPIPTKIRSYADRIETAQKHEKEKLGNAAAMREALEKVRFYLPHFLQYMRLHREDAEAGGYYGSILEVVNAALSAPPRNCDVGTTDEQAKRFHSFCRKFQSEIQGMCSPLYPCIDCYDMCHCITKWSQMPYEEGVAE